MTRVHNLLLKTEQYPSRKKKDILKEKKRYTIHKIGTIIAIIGRVSNIYCADPHVRDSCYYNL
jgi:hypothetical protein